MRVLGAWHGRLDRPLELLERRVADEHPQVRLEAVRALAAVGGKRSAEIALRALDRPLDTYLDYGLWLTLRELEPAWLPALQEGKLDFGGVVGRLGFALQAVGSDKVVQPLVSLIRAASCPGRRKKRAGPARRRRRAGRAGAGLRPRPATRAARPRGGTACWRPWKRRPGSAASSRPARSMRWWPLVEARQQDRGPPRRAVGRREGAARPDRPGTGRQGDRSSRARRPSTAWPPSAGQASKATLEALLAKAASGEIPRRALIALAGLDLAEAAKRAVAVLAAGKDGSGAEDVFAAFLQRKGGADLLAAALAGKTLPADVARVGRADRAHLGPATRPGWPRR